MAPPKRFGKKQGDENKAQTPKTSAPAAPAASAAAAALAAARALAQSAAAKTTNLDAIANVHAAQTAGAPHLVRALATTAPASTPLIGSELELLRAADVRAAETSAGRTAGASLRRAVTLTAAAVPAPLAAPLDPLLLPPALSAPPPPLSWLPASSDSNPPLLASTETSAPPAPSRVRAALTAAEARRAARAAAQEAARRRAERTAALAAAGVDTPEKLEQYVSDPSTFTAPATPATGGLTIANAPRPSRVAGAVAAAGAGPGHLAAAEEKLRALSACRAALAAADAAAAAGSADSRWLRRTGRVAAARGEVATYYSYIVCEEVVDSGLRHLVERARQYGVCGRAWVYGSTTVIILYAPFDPLSHVLAQATQRTGARARVAALGRLSSRVRLPVVDGEDCFIVIRPADPRRAAKWLQVQGLPVGPFCPQNSVNDQELVVD